jgi:hypothetical protein
VREIVSAEDSDVKFITSDHPVTIFNHRGSSQSLRNRGKSKGAVEHRIKYTVATLPS